jgi:hypothetical protein
MSEGLARCGIDAARASPQCLLDQCPTDAAIGPGHQNCSAFRFHNSSMMLYLSSRLSRLYGDDVLCGLISTGLISFEFAVSSLFFLREIFTARAARPPVDTEPATTNPTVVKQNGHIVHLQDG